MGVSPSQPVTTHTRVPKGLLSVVILLVMGLLLIGRRTDSVVSDSPDGSYQIVVREKWWSFIDRNFRVILLDQLDGTERVLLASYDQSPSITHERFAWSGDSSKVVLLGDRYFVVPDSRLENGEIVFLMYDAVSHKVWCNTVHDRGFPHISAEQVADAFGTDLD